MPANAIRTITSHVQKAKEFYDRTDVYFAIGRTTPWPDENDPPVLDVNVDKDIQEPIGYKKVETKYYVVPDQENGTITYNSSKWRIVTDTNIFIENCRWVYIKTSIQYDELPLTSYRQIAIYKGLTPYESVPQGQYNLLPSEVLDRGTTEVLYNDVATPRRVNEKEDLEFIIEF